MIALVSQQAHDFMRWVTRRPSAKCAGFVQVIEHWGDDSSGFSFCWLKIYFIYVLLSDLTR